MDAPSPMPSQRPFGATTPFPTGKERGHDRSDTGEGDGFANLVTAPDGNGGTAGASPDDTPRDVPQPAAPISDTRGKTWSAADNAAVGAQFPPPPDTPSPPDTVARGDSPVAAAPIVPPRPDTADLGTRPEIRPDAPVAASPGPPRDPAASHPPAPSFPRSPTVSIRSQIAEAGAGSGPSATDAGPSAPSLQLRGDGPPVATPRPVGRTETPMGAAMDQRVPADVTQHKADALAQHRGPARPEAGQAADDTRHGAVRDLAAKTAQPGPKGNPAQEGTMGVPPIVTRAPGTDAETGAPAPLPV
jgi:hypothetical protein